MCVCLFAGRPSLYWLEIVCIFNQYRPLCFFVDNCFFCRQYHPWLSVGDVLQRETPRAKRYGRASLFVNVQCRSLDLLGTIHANTFDGALTFFMSSIAFFFDPLSSLCNVMWLLSVRGMPSPVDTALALGMREKSKIMVRTLGN